ncbi:MAG TPA: VIT1/CCC1 family protein [Candidatus Limnocylindrales bacterium]|jgi:VIT1/CCC1 family predicted Fe2+/Mn2+ transporter/rubrerythrin
MAVTVTDTARSLENLKLERDAIVLYEALARIERDERRSAAFDHIAANERRHAEIWATRLRELGVDVPPPGSPRLRIRFIVLLARLFGTRSVSDLVQALEGDEEELYEAQADPDVESIAADEREHAEIWKRLDAGAPASGPARSTGARFRLANPARDGRQVARLARSPSEIGLAERWHRNAQSGTLRAVIFGVSDGLVSNLSLVMGVAGAAGAAGEPRFILLAGIAGLLAGSCSMAAGEYISMQSQRELFERQIELERAELEAMPEEEEAELVTVFRSKGFTQDEAARIAHRLIADPKTALDTLVREELGLDPDELGSPWGAATGSFLAFAAGAAIPVIPYLLGTGAPAFMATIVLSLAALFAVGAGVSLLTGRSTLYSGTRQVGIGAAAAAITFLVGNLLGVTVA